MKTINTLCVLLLSADAFANKERKEEEEFTKVGTLKRAVINCTASIEIMAAN